MSTEFHLTGVSLSGVSLIGGQPGTIKNCRRRGNGAGKFEHRIDTDKRLPGYPRQRRKAKFSGPAP